MIPVGFASWWMLQYDLPAILKFLMVVSFATILCFLTYHYGVQSTWISVLLNGRRFDLEWPWLDTKQSDDRN
jgi:glucan biosynthesis protein C